MHDRKQQLYFLLLVLAGTLTLSFFVLRPFLYVLALAMVCAAALQPVYQAMVRIMHGRRGFSALITILFTALIVLVPLALLGARVVEEAQQMYSSLAGGGVQAVAHTVVTSMPESVQRLFPSSQELSGVVERYATQGLGWLLQNLGSVFASVVATFANTLLFLIALYFLLKDGKALKMAVIAISPLADADDETIARRLEAAIRAVLQGRLLIAVLQGALASVGFSLFGVPNGVLWGGVAALAALIPGIGTALVILPAAGFLFFSGDTVSGLGLLAWGTGVVGLVDNFLSPKLIGRGMQLHPLIVLLSVLGGLGFFGFAGFLLGPLVVSLFFALLDIYSSFLQKEKVM